MELENTCDFCPPEGVAPTGLTMTWRGKAGIIVRICFSCILEMADEFRAATIPVSRDREKRD